MGPKKKNLPGRFDIDMTPLHDFMKHMDSFFNESFKQMNDYFHLQPFWVNVKEYDNHYLIKAELNGLNRDQIKIVVVGNQIQISIEDHQMNNLNDSKNNYNYKKQSIFKKERVISLPFDIPEKDVKASFKNQHLYITIPKQKVDRTIIDIDES